MVRRFFLIHCLLALCFSLAAQHTLNLHTTTQGVITFAFTDKPEISFPSKDVLKVASTALTVEFPYGEVSKITFNDADATPVQSITVRDGISSISIYDLSGRLILSTPARSGSATIDLSPLPSGVFIVKDGRRSYKVRKQ